MLKNILQLYLLIKLLISYLKKMKIFLIIF